MIYSILNYIILIRLRFLTAEPKTQPSRLEVLCEVEVRRAILFRAASPLPEKK